MPANLLHDSRISRLVELALMEDVGMGDVTSEATIGDDVLGDADVVCKAEGVIAGLELVQLVFQMCDQSITVTPAVHDGERVAAGGVLAHINGMAKGILKGERTALNFLQRMSGIATLTRRYVDAIAGTGARITDTRKTAPGLRVLDKLAVRIGGGVNHRFGLDDMVLIKDNHIVAAGGITEAVERCNRYLEQQNLRVKIEVETKNIDEVHEALRCRNVHRIMLDNFPLDEMRRAVQLIARRTDVEASGGITLDNVRAVAETGVDFISVGALTHSVKALDISLELRHVR